MFDNFSIDVTGKGRETLLLAVRIALAHNSPNGGSPGYLLGDAHGLVILWSVDPQQPGQVALPFTLDAEGITDFIWRWLEVTEYGPEPDHDGDNGKGWRVYTSAWGHVGPYRSAVLAAKPAWACYGK